VNWPRLPNSEYTRPTQIFFSDSVHGWVVWRSAIMHTQRYALLATQDGGSTWDQLPEPPGGGPLQFISPRQGWMIGGPEESKGIFVPESENLWATQDGGAHWRVVKVPLPPPPPPADVDDSVASEPYYTEFRFTDSRHGLLVARRPLSGYKFQAFTCATENGGKSWRISSFEPYSANPSLVGGQIIWSIVDLPKSRLYLQSGEHVTRPALVGGFSLQGTLGDVRFLDDSNGWAVYGHDERVDLVATTDGGKTFGIISPEVVTQAPLPPP
jgi:photosystem II stability/assembly factor-like uncharacterized protein